MPKYELTQYQLNTLRRLRLVLGKPESWNPKALEDIAIDLITGFGPGTKDKASIINARAILLDDFAGTFEAKEVCEVTNDSPAWKDDIRVNLTNARDAIDRTLVKMG